MPSCTDLYQIFNYQPNNIGTDDKRHEGVYQNTTSDQTQFRSSRTLATSNHRKLHYSKNPPFSSAAIYVGAVPTINLKMKLLWMLHNDGFLDNNMEIATGESS
jgi:hypothetical protein